MEFHVINRNKIGEFGSQMNKVNSYNFSIPWSRMLNTPSPIVELANWARLLLSLGQNYLFLDHQETMIGFGLHYVCFCIIFGLRGGMCFGQLIFSFR